MRPIPFLAAVALILAPLSTTAANPAEALSLTRASAAMEGGNALTRGELYPLIGLLALAVISLALLDGSTEPQEEPVSS